MQLPNFFIVGAAKAGTTSLWRYLLQHPDVFMPSDIMYKEPAYFSDIKGIRNLDEYEALFSGVTAEKMIGEASTAYLTSLESPVRIKDKIPKAKIIIMLRNPIDRAYSLYNWMASNGYEPIESFESALEAEVINRNGSDTFKHSAPEYYYNYLYYHSGLYSEQIRRYLDNFSREQICFIIFEEFKANVKQEVNKVFAFLGVDDSIIPDFKIHNSGNTPYSASLQFFIRQELSQYLRPPFSNPHPLRNEIIDKLMKLNTKSDKSQPVDESMRKVLREKYTQDVQKTSELIGQRLSNWWTEFQKHPSSETRPAPPSEHSFVTDPIDANRSSNKVNCKRSVSSNLCLLDQPVSLEDLLGHEEQTSESEFLNRFSANEKNSVVISDTPISRSYLQDKSYKVVHLCSHDFGGAGKAAYRLHKGLQRIGVHSTMLVMSKSSNDESVKVLPDIFTEKIISCSNPPSYNSSFYAQQNMRWQQLLAKYPNKSSHIELFSDGKSGTRLDLVKEIQEADIINLHWVAGLIDYSGSAASFGDKPIVWTLHDMNPFTGGCHYSRNCQKYRDGCGACHLLGSIIDDDLSREIWNLKFLAYQNLNLNIVTPSNWLGNCALSSKLFSSFHTTVIPNGLPSNIFKPYPKGEIRKSLKIPQTAKVILFGAASLANERKGFKYLLEALNKLALKGRDDIIILAFGHSPSDLEISSRFTVYSLGHVADEFQLALAYSASDLFIISSVEDNLPNTAIEAMACGIPIVGFDLGGIPDIIDHKKTGFLAEARNTDDLSEGIEWVLSESDRGMDFSKHCRVKVEKEFAFELQAEAYKQLYNKISKNQIDNRAETKALNQKGKDHIHHGDFGKISNSHQNPLKIFTTNSNDPNDIDKLRPIDQDEDVNRSAEEIYEKAQKIINDGQEQAAIGVLEKLLCQSPDFALAHNDLGVLYFGDGQKVKALKHYQEATGLQPENITFQKNLADFYYLAVGQIEAALNIYVKILDTNPRDIETLTALAKICIDLEKTEDAKDFYDRILALDPSNRNAVEKLNNLKHRNDLLPSSICEYGENCQKCSCQEGYLVSTIVSCYNSEDFILGRLEDLENQTIADRLEIVVVNSGSQQNEEKIITEFQEKYSNIKYIKTEHRETVYAAWNRGIKAAQGQYITNANTDDRLRHDALEVMVNALEENPEIALVYANVIITETENETFERCTPVGYFNWLNFNREDLLNKGCFVGPQPMWRRNVHDEYGYFDDSFITSGDYEFWLRISQSHSFMHLPVQLGLYLRSQGSIEHSNREKQREENQKILNMYRKARSCGKIIRQIQTSSSQGHSEPGSGNTKSPETIYQNIQAGMGNKQPEETIDELEKMAAVFPKFALAFNDLGVLYYNTGNREKAKKFYEEAVQLDPGNMIFQKNLADFLFVELGKIEEALQIYVSILSVNPHDVETLLITGHICVALKKFDDAKEFYNRVLELEPGNEDADNNLQALDKHPAANGLLPSESASMFSVLADKVESNDLEPDRSAVEQRAATVSIIISLDGIQNRVKECIKSVMERTSDPHEILLINRGATKGILKWAQQLVKDNDHYHIIECARQAGRAESLNQAVQKASGEMIVLMHNDVAVPEGWLRAFKMCINLAPNIGVVGPMSNRTEGIQQMIHYDESDRLEFVSAAKTFYEQNQYRRVTTQKLSDFCLAFPRELPDKIGYFDEQFVSEEVVVKDFCNRASSGGYQNLIAADTYVHHFDRHKVKMSALTKKLASAQDQKKYKEKWNGTQNPQTKAFLPAQLLARAEELSQKGQINPAVEVLLGGIGVQPEDLRFYLALSEILLAAKRFQGAKDALTEMSPADENQEIRKAELLAYAEEGLESYEAAQAHIEQVLAMNPGHAPALNLKGILAYRNDDRHSAEKYFKRAIDADSGYGDPYTNLGMLQLEADRAQDALKFFEKGFRLTPTDLDIATNYHTLIAGIAEIAEYEKAENVAREAAALYPNNQKIKYMLIDFMIQQGKYEMAMADIEDAIIKFGTDNGIIGAALKVREKLGPITIQKFSKKPPVSLCMIIKDEEKYLSRCMASVKPIVDEMIVVDTGSTDRSKDIAIAFGAKVYDYEWGNDFGEARNYSISKASCEWILIMDGDEVISPLDHAHFSKIVKKTPRAPIAYSITTRNYNKLANIVGWEPNDGTYPDEEAAIGWLSSEKVRLFYGKDQIWFEGAVHELVDPVLKRNGIEIKKCPIPVHHYGRLDKEKLDRKGEIYFDIGQKKLSAMGDDLNALRELAVQATILEKNQEAFELWQRLLALNPNPNLAAIAYVNMGTIYNRLGKFEDALEAGKKAVECDPDLKEARYNHAMAELHCGNAPTTIRVLEDLLKGFPDYPPAQFILAAAYCCADQKEKGLEGIRKLRDTPMGAHLDIPCLELAQSLISAIKMEYALWVIGAAIESDIVNPQLLALFKECLNMKAATQKCSHISQPPQANFQEAILENLPQ